MRSIVFSFLTADQLLEIVSKLTKEDFDFVVKSKNHLLNEISHRPMKIRCKTGAREEVKPRGARTDIQVQMFRCTSRSWICRCKNWKSGASSSVTGVSVSRHLRLAGASVLDATGGVSAVPVVSTAFTARVSLSSVFCGDTLVQPPGGRLCVCRGVCPQRRPGLLHLPHLPSHPGS